MVDNSEYKPWITVDMEPFVEKGILKIIHECNYSSLTTVRVLHNIAEGPRKKNCMMLIVTPCRPLILSNITKCQTIEILKRVSMSPC